jgi:DNA-binding beta-propeller fold protein YncE
MNRSRKHGSVALAIVYAVLNPLVALASCPNDRILHPSLQIIAGNGAPSQGNGIAREAGFVGPLGVAIGPDGSIYVADTFGQTIRRVKDGVVTNFAGVSTPSFSPQQRIGGYRDGPAATALFSLPSGIAVDKHGTVFVADTNNHVIRKIEHGIVTVFAGSAAAGGARDGTLRNARFTFPRDIAIDNDGNLYVADGAVGVRKISTDGTVSTLSFGDDDKRVCGIAARGSGANTILAMTDSRSIVIKQAASIQRLLFADGVEPQNEGRTVGFGCRLSIFDRHTVVMADPANNTVKFVRIPGPSGPVAKVLASAIGPAGLAIGRDNSVVFAETGRRRINVIRNIDPRGLLGPDLAGLVQPANRYRIIFFGDSFVFYGVTWPESMEAQVEAGLGRDHNQYGLTKCPSVIAIRYSGMNLLDVPSFLKGYLGDGGADLVIVPVDGTTLELAERKRSDLSASALDDLIRRQLNSTERALAANGTKILLVPVPYSYQVSPLEVPTLNADFLDQFQRAQQFEDRVASFGLPTLKLAAAMELAERSQFRTPLGSNAESHPSPQGFTWIGEAIRRYLESWKPWSP